MHGCSYRWTVCVLTAAVLAAAGATQAQEASVQPLPDAGYQYYGYGTPLAANDVSTTTPVSFKDEQTNLADEVAELRAWKEKVEKKEAEAKKKAAGAPTVKVGGRIYVDTAMYGQNGASKTQVGDAENGTEFRAARLYVKGDAFDVFNYKAEFDFAGTTTVDSDGVNNKTIDQVLYKDVYMGISELPLLGNVRVGHFKEPFGLEQLTSRNYITFMERSLGDEGVFVPGRNIGVMAFDWSENERMTWAVGGFVNHCPENPPLYHDNNGQAAVTMRATYLPWYDEATNGRGLFHTGAAYSYRTNGEDTLRLRSRPESHLAPYVLDTGVIANAPDYQIYSGEAAFVYGAFSAQAEYFGLSLNRDAGFGNQQFNGCYVLFSYFLTGENRTYDRRSGTFNRIVPFGNFFRVRDENGYVQTGLGAWEVAYRYSYGDLIDDDVNGGRTGDHTVGLNWYLNPYMRLMFNYIRSTTDDAAALDGVIDVYQMRAQIDF